MSPGSAESSAGAWRTSWRARATASRNELPRGIISEFGCRFAKCASGKKAALKGAARAGAGLARGRARPSGQERQKTTGSLAPALVPLFLGGRGGNGPADSLLVPLFLGGRGGSGAR